MFKKGGGNARRWGFLWALGFKPRLTSWPRPVVQLLSSVWQTPHIFLTFFKTLQGPSHIFQHCFKTFQDPPHIFQHCFKTLFQYSSRSSTYFQHCFKTLQDPLNIFQHFFKTLQGPLCATEVLFFGACRCTDPHCVVQLPCAGEVTVKSNPPRECARFAGPRLVSQHFRAGK